MTGGFSQRARVLSATLANPDAGRSIADARRFEEALERWNEAEAKLAKAHLDLIRDLERDIAALKGDA
jgi:hypothetical protein